MSPAPDQASTLELRAALEAVLARYFETESRVVKLQRRQFDYHSSYPLEELNVQLDDGTCLAMIFKDVNPASMLDEARQAKPAFLHDPLREIETYRTILARHCLGTATCYGAVVDDQRDRYWLFLEKVSGNPLFEVGDFQIWRQVARWLAEMHRQLGTTTDQDASSTHLTKYDSDFYRRWLDRALAGIDEADSAAGDAFRKLAEAYDQVVRRLTAMPRNVIHGEFYASNILVHNTDDGGPRICAIDWEMAGSGPGLIDLAALIAGNWSDAERESLASAYYEALKTDAPAWDEFVTSLNYCRLHEAVQRLGWSRQWQPPAGHAQDWLAVSIQIARKLDLQLK